MKKQDALDYHSSGRPGKIAVVPTKPLNNQRDLALAYTPGVAEPCLAIQANPDDAYTYTARGNLVAVVTNGTAVLGLGNIGALAGKPVMEGKGNLFKQFADIDVFDIEVNAEDPEDVIRFCQMLEPTVGGINLEDIRAPDCFRIEEELKRTLKIPVFHDDQHGTAIISGAALLNALEIVGKKIDQVRVVFSGAGAAAIATAKHYVRLGVAREHITMCDVHGVVYEGRTIEMDPYKARFARATDMRTITEALRGADVFVGLSRGGVITGAMIAAMAPDPIVFALANPTPEILPNEVLAARPDAIVATGRSDYPNQVNNLLGFPFIFRGALDARATQVTEEMKMAATRALAALAREPVPDSVSRLYGLKNIAFGRDYLIPFPFDPRVLLWVAPAVAWAAVASGVARVIIDAGDYRALLESRLSRARGIMRGLINQAVQDPRRVVFPEGEDERIIKAARIVLDEGIAEPVLLGNIEAIRRTASEVRISLEGLTLEDPADASKREAFAQYLLERRKHKGMTEAQARERVCDPDYFGSLMVALGDADALVSGVTQQYPATIRPALEVIGAHPKGGLVSGFYMLVFEKHTVFLRRHDRHDRAHRREAGAHRDLGGQAAPDARHRAADRDALLLELRFGEGRGARARGRRGQSHPPPRPQPGGGRRDAGRSRDERGEAARAVPAQPAQWAGQRIDLPELERGQHRVQVTERAGRGDGHRADPRRHAAPGARAGSRVRCAEHRQHGGRGRRGRAVTQIAGASAPPS